jgi:hypothetical protein
LKLEAGGWRLEAKDLGTCRFRQDLQDLQDLGFQPSPDGKAEESSACRRKKRDGICRAAAELFPAVFRTAGNNPVNPVDPVGHLFLKAFIRQDLQDLQDLGFQLSPDGQAEDSSACGARSEMVFVAQRLIVFSLSSG